MTENQGQLNTGNLPVGHVLIQQRVAGGQELEIIVWYMVYCSRRIHLKNDQKHGLGQIELKACSWRTGRV